MMFSLLVLLFRGSRLLAVLLANVTLIGLLKMPGCDPAWYACAPSPAYYPPQVWTGNASVTGQTIELLEQALRLEPNSIGIQEHLIELDYATSNDLEATRLFQQNLDTPSRRNALLRLPQPIYYFLHSRLAEHHSNYLQAIGDVQKGLESADFTIDPEREVRESRRLSELYGQIIQSSSPAELNSEVYFSAALQSACVADWSVAGERSLEAWGKRSTLNPEQQSMIERLLAWLARQRDNLDQEKHWLTLAGEIKWDQWSIKDPYLWLGNWIVNANPRACSRGAQDIFAWYSGVNPASAQGLYLKGLMLFNRRDYAGARDAFAEAYQRDMSHVGSACGLAIAYEYSGDLEESVRWYKRSIELWPTNGEYHARLARVYQTLGQNDQASDYFERAIALSPQQDVFLVWAGYFYLDRGNLVKARALFEDALQVNPSNPYANQGLTKINTMEVKRK